MSKRGQVTKAIQSLSKELLGYEIDKAELRLMPYVQHVMMNEQRIDPNKCNGEDREVLARWREAGHVEGGAGGLSITRDFWDIINSILWTGYVAYREDRS